MEGRFGHPDLWSVLDIPRAEDGSGEFPDELSVLSKGAQRIIDDLAPFDRGSPSVQVTCRFVPTPNSVLAQYRAESGSESAWLDYGKNWLIFIYLNGKASTVFEVLTGGLPDPLYVEMADRIQEEVIDEVRGARPRCPRHAHPLEPALVDDGGGWVCPELPLHRVCRFGEYRDLRLAQS
jgi:hypothetical protein